MIKTDKQIRFWTCKMYTMQYLIRNSVKRVFVHYYLITEDFIVDHVEKSIGSIDFVV
jgi:hypothetical protein